MNTPPAECYGRWKKACHLDPGVFHLPQMEIVCHLDFSENQALDTQMEKPADGNAAIFPSGGNARVYWLSGRAMIWRVDYGASGAYSHLTARMQRAPSTNRSKPCSRRSPSPPGSTGRAERGAARQRQTGVYQLCGTSLACDGGAEVRAYRHATHHRCYRWMSRSAEARRNHARRSQAAGYRLHVPNGLGANGVPAPCRTGRGHVGSQAVFP